MFSYLASIREFLYLVHVQSTLTLSLCAATAFFQSSLKIKLIFLNLNLALTSFVGLLVLEEMINSQSPSAFSVSSKI